MITFKTIIHCFVPYGIKLKIIKFVFCNLAKVVPTNRNHYLFLSMHGRNYGCNIKYLAEYINNKDPNAKIFIAFDSLFYPRYKDIVENPVKIGSIKYYWRLISCRYICSNERTNNAEYPFKRDGQFYLQTWHGTGPKKAEADIDWGDEYGYPSYAKTDSSKIDYLISGNSYNSRFFKKSFWYSGYVYEIGTPRCDVFFEEHPDFVDKVYDTLKIPRSSKILLYAPTFRNDGDSLKYYDFDYHELLNCINNRFGGNYAFVTRLHPDIISGEKINQCKKMFPNSYDATLYPDMQELLYVADILLTDYSSCMFDFLLTNKPCFLYTKDKNEYDRGFYIPIEEWPIPQFTNINEMKTVIKGFDYCLYQANVRKFLSERIGSIEDGNACKRCYKLLKEGFI